MSEGPPIENIQEQNIQNPIETMEKISGFEMVPGDDQEKKDRFWHATYTGPQGEIFDSILSRGLLPKSAIENETNGNSQTHNEDATYITKYGHDALHYLKTAVGYVSEGGLPLLVVVDATEKDTSYSYDTDISVWDAETPENKNLWASFISSFENINDFLSEIIPSKTGMNIQQALIPLSGRATKDCEQEIKQAVDSLPSEIMFLEGDRLRRYLGKADPKRWEAFLEAYTHRLGPKVGPNRRLLKEGGFTGDRIERTYVISPNGDPNWKKWASLIPPEIANQWDSWEGKQARDGSLIPGNGKLVRVS